VKRLAARLLTGLVVLSCVAGCATVQNPDPLEPMNRKVFAFNDSVDRAVLKPVATVYQNNVPQPVRTGVTNFFSNVKDVWSAANLFLQGRVGDGFSDLMRFGTNTVFGVFGIFDVATDLGMPKHGEDLGQTLGRWGMGPGAYLVLPFLGPSTLRDVTDLPFDMQASPTTWVERIPVRNSLTATNLVNTRANLLSATGLMDDIALDKYTFLRDAYLQRRRSLVYDGNPPPDPADADEPESADDAAPVPAVPASAASAS
jgi:phospholipid-binding lipoprotein MlaA